VSAPPFSFGSWRADAHADAPPAKAMQPQCSRTDLMTGKDIKNVLVNHTAELMALPGVVGVGQGECRGKPCIIVFVKSMTGLPLAQFPSVIEGHRVEVEESGEFRAT